ncbi:MAG: hypothetical protein KGZ63_08940 [Clostridiales bacterium]|jgi:hypothetical protein|nr:hypothetical protein [Clostridiales bacterium]
MKSPKKTANSGAVDEIQTIVAGLDVMSSLLTEVKAGSKLGKTFVLLLNLFLLENRQPDGCKTIADLSVQSLADSVNMDCEELTGILSYLTEQGLIDCQTK